MKAIAPIEYSNVPALTALLQAVRLVKKDADSATRRQNQPGDLQAFNRLVLENQDSAFNLAYYILGEPDLAEDVTQKAFIKAYLQFHQFKGQSFRGCLLAIVRNACYDELRKIKSQPALSLESLESRETGWPEWMGLDQRALSPEQAAEQNERDRAVRAALGTMSEAFRSVIVLVDLQGLDYGEAAQALGVPVGTLKNRLARARRQLTALPELARLRS